MPLIVMAGLPGTGKSSLAKGIAQALSHHAYHKDWSHTISRPIILNKDEIRSALFPPELIEYSTTQDDFCMNILLSVVTYLLQKDPQRPVLLDGRTFTRDYQVQTVEKHMQSVDAHLYWIYCTCDAKTAQQRLLRDAQHGSHPAVNRTPDLYEKIAMTAEPLTATHLLVNTEQSLDTCIDISLKYLGYAD